MQSTPSTSRGPIKKSIAIDFLVAESFAVEYCSRNYPSARTGAPMRYVTWRRRFVAFTLVELLVVIGIIAVLIGILLPVLSKARESAVAVQCMSNLRQFAIADQMYVNTYNWHMPGWWVGPTGG